jgi:hypothetical protein
MNFKVTCGSALAIVAALATTTAEASGLANGPRKLTVRMAFTNNGADIANGGMAGRGRFTAAGAIKDRGRLVVYRTKQDALITLRFVAVGKRGKLTFLVKIDTMVGTSRWTIASGTKAYRGLHGKGTEHENATYTVSTLTGTVWR